MNQSPAITERTERLESFKDSLLIVKTGKDSNGHSFNDIGKLNQAAWIGENSAFLITEIERLEFALQRVINLLEHADPLYALKVARDALEKQ